MTAVSTITTEPQLANLALRKLKSRIVLTALPGTTPEGAVLDEALDAARNAVLQAVDWPFARKWLQLLGADEDTVAAASTQGVQMLTGATGDGVPWTLTGDIDPEPVVTFFAPLIGTYYYLVFLVDNEYKLYKNYLTSPPSPPFSLDLGTLIGTAGVLEGLTLTCTTEDPWDEWTTNAWGLTWDLVVQETGLDWDFRYELPDDCIAPREIWPGGRNVRPDQRIPFEVQASENAAGQALLTDQEEPYLRYTKLVSAPASWSPLFVEALAWRLAADCALPLTGDVQTAQLAEQMAERALAEAKAASFNEVREEQPPDSPTIAARG